MTLVKRSTVFLFVTLGLLALLATAFYLLGAEGVVNSYILNLRLKKLLTFGIVAVIASFATFSFQAVTGNRFLTPSVLGLESFYVLMQSLFLAIFWRWSQGVAPRSVTEFFIVMGLQCGFFLLLQPVIKRLLGKGLGLILLICMTLGTFFRSLSTFLQVLMDPNEYDKLQSRLFASLQNANQEVLYLVLALTLVLCLVLYRKGKVLDVFYLGKDNARLLGIQVEKEQQVILWLVVILVAASTALVGPMSFLGFILVNLTYQLVKDYRHQTLFLVGSLLGYVILLVAQTVVERVFNFNVSIATMIELGGGIFFFYLLYKERRTL
ncbi:iron chelate uptake ABC transporter family permease subunit [Streptococcus sp. DD12]|uniref:iron chelate uptake ABC transporter family permease subunit n=1 Tax=Streptococcus sp. DD12 TaxID=1777880 RepID=UPI000794F641|nr:iron chelate uptake ABC transporter family permease subunit [Streptococcus sp. DD12]KXT75915.1 Iron compound ABC uptake transporter permease protein PiuC [Streptococcus sp. DD12]